MVIEGDKAVVALISVIVARELWDIVKIGLFKKDDVLKANTEATLLNTAEIKAIRTELLNLSRIPADVTEAHTKIRVLEERLKNLDH